jgi:hypothetical protein
MKAINAQCPVITLHDSFMVKFGKDKLLMIDSGDHAKIINCIKILINSNINDFKESVCKTQSEIIQFYDINNANNVNNVNNNLTNISNILDNIMETIGITLHTQSQSQSQSQSQTEQTQTEQSQSQPHNPSNIKIMISKKDSDNNNNNLLFIEVITQYYNHANAKRQQELDKCFAQLLENPFVKCVHNLHHDKTTIPPEFTSHPKYYGTIIDSWLTFDCAANYANNSSNSNSSNTITSNSIICICVSDVFLDIKSDKWDELYALLDNNIYNKNVICLSSEETDGKGLFWRDPRIHQLAYAIRQCAWIFKTPLNLSHDSSRNLPINVIGNDLIFAKQLRNSGYTPINRTSHFKVWHLDAVRQQDSEVATDDVKTMTNYSANSTNSANNVNSVNNDKSYFLLPDFDVIQQFNLDSLVSQLKLTPMQIYELKCELFSKFIKFQ